MIFKPFTLRILFVLPLAVVLLLLFPVTVQAQALLQEGAPATLPKLTVDLLVTLAGSILSVVCYLIPPVQRWLSRDLGEWTPLAMAGVLLVIAVVYQALWCQWQVDCVIANWQPVLLVWVGAIGTNFAAYKAVVKPSKDKAKADVAAVDAMLKSQIG